MMGPHCWGWGSGSFFGYPFGLIAGLLFCSLVIYGVFVLVSSIKRGSLRADRIETPMDILKRRYARGEINQEEFARMKTNLEN